MNRLTILFISADIGGNVPPTLAIASELARRGHRVSLAGIAPRSGDARPDGIASVPLPALSRIDVASSPGPAGHLPSLARMALGRTVTREVRALVAARPADAVVIDGLMLSSLREAVRRGVPTAALFHTFGTFWSNGMGSLAAHAALRPFGLSPRQLMPAVDALLLPTDPALDPAGAGGSRFVFEWLGTTENGVPPAPRVPGAPRLVLVSLSTAAQRNQRPLYQRIIDALAQLAGSRTPVRAIVTTGGAEIGGELQPRPNVEVRGRFPHADLMPHTDLVIGHGGHSTTLRALAHGIPVLILPLDLLSDQPMIGHVVETHGLGRTIPRSSTVETIRETVRDLLADAPTAAAARRTGERLRSHRGAAAGADRIERIAQV